MNEPQPELPNLDGEGDRLEPKSPLIELPKDLELLEKLRRKLQEYKQRLETEKAQSPYQAPETFADTHYKIAVLGKLLSEGSVSTYDLSRELNERDGYFDANAFQNACSVIHDYATTGGQAVDGGTGLK
jgi:hypothetical protein